MNDNNTQMIIETLFAIKEEQGRVSAKIEAVDDKVASVLVQTIKTNGRVSKSEDEIATLKAFKNRVLGGCAVVTIVISALYQYVTGKG
jgi:hypothetical protein